jgi:hypothetical protein
MVMDDRKKSTEKIPEFLYHYTTIDTLALILKEKKIKFSPLNSLDDLQEDQTSDAQQYGRYVFVSSWTEEKMESIPMWNMYSSLESGVRIGLPAMPFEEYSLSSDVVVNHIPDQILSMYKQGDIDIESYFDIAKSPYFILKHMPMLYKINYSEPALQKKSNLKYVLNAGIEEKLAQLGRYKRIYWGFQKEWRYVLLLLPIGGYGKNDAKSNYRKISTIENTFFYIPFKFYYLLLNRDAYKKMEIVLSPKISKGNRVLIELLKEKYNNAMKIKESSLKGELR